MLSLTKSGWPEQCITVGRSLIHYTDSKRNCAQTLSPCIQISYIVYFQGEKGAKSILEILKRELMLAMQLTGEFKSIDARNREF